ncbi:MAG: AAA family ATPase [Ruminococcus sp.]|nr:AAA family ATPase [Ruminococcus sp.]
MNQSNKDILDYIWIEKFRKIENQGFHFTNKYKYSYDNESNKLTRKENPEYVDDFFGENVEINAIVGMNGAGKTSLLTALMSCFSADPSSVGDDGYIDFSKSNIVLAFRSGIVYYIYDTIGDNGRIQKGVYIQSVEGVDITDKHYSKPLDMHCLFHNNVLDYQTFDSPFTNGCNTNISTSALMHEYSNDDTENNPVKTYFFREFEKQLDLLNYIEKGNNKLILEGLKWPEYSIIQVKSIDIIKDEIIEISNKVLYEKGDGFSKISYSEYEDAINRIFDLMVEEQEYGGTALEQFKSRIAPCIIGVLFLEVINELKKWNDYLNIREQIKNFCESIDSFWVENDSSWKNVNKIIQGLMNCDNSPLKNINLISDFITFIDNCDETGNNLDVPIDVFKLNLSFRNNNHDSLGIQQSKFWEIYKPLGLVYNFLDISWNLSSGEQARLELFARIFHYYECNILYSPKQDINNLLILLDEADMLLHPEWQRTFVKDIKEFAENLFSKHNIHVQIMIATHSPIMLSDIPRQNVLFLTSKQDHDSDSRIGIDEQGCDTFAANIFQLFREAFFIGDTGIGAYAEEKLKEIVSFIHSKNDNNESLIKKYISAVGDNFLRHKLEQEYLIYRAKSNSTESEQVKRIKELENERNSLNAEKAKDTEFFKNILSLLNHENKSSQYKRSFDDYKAEELKEIIKKLENRVKEGDVES